ncbi:hypothetical protein FRC14_000958 [Serendipita sp. 396]|nr:hypothetical protein FRC14_000958 [Serendipita sp. 396]
MNPTHSHDDTHYIDAQAPRFISHQFPQKPSVSSGQFSDENQAQNPASGQMEPPSTTGNEITFEFYNPLEKKKHKQKSAGGGLESAHTQQTASSSASVSQFSPDHPHTGAQTEFVFEKGTVPSGGSKTKKERKSASSSGKSKATESTGTSKSLKKSSKDQDPTARRQVTDDAPEATGASGPAGHPSQQRAATSSSTTESALPSSSRHVSKASQSSGIPDDTTVDDDIMADLDMAELSHAPQMTTTGASSSRAASQPRYSIDHDGDLDMEILPPTPPRDRSVSTKPSVSPAPPSISLAPSTTSKKTAAAALASSPAPSPSPSTFLAPAPVSAPKKSSSTSKSKAKPQTATSKSTKKKADGPAKGGTKSKADGQQKGKDADWGWGAPTSGRAAAAAAANALLMSGGYDEGMGSGRDGTPMSTGHGAANTGDDGDDDDEEVDNRLYCVCRERYDHRFMLGCDHCDEWFHPPCLGMEEFQCDLLEHFYCASCRKADPSLVTTWRTRCSNGIQHPFPDSAEACWRAALPPLSKYCSKECGIEAMERKITPYVQAKSGLQIPRGNAGNESLGFIALPRNTAVKSEMSKLWKSVQDARKRDGVVVDAQATKENGKGSGVSVVSATSSPAAEFSRLTQTYTNLTQDFNSLTRDSQFATRDLEFILARGRLAKLAIAWSEKQENLARCCFDSRLLLEGREWEEWVTGEGKAVLEGGLDAPTAPAISNLAGGSGPNTNEGRSGTPGDGEEEEFVLDIEADSPWCDGRRKCERHFGWQKLCMAEYELNKGTKELALQRTMQKKNDVQNRMDSTQALLENLELQPQGSDMNVDVKKEEEGTSQLNIK